MDLPLLDGGPGLDSVRDWTSMLSLGEQQRLGFARVVVSAPRLAILEEASSALDLETGARHVLSPRETRATDVYFCGASP